jgi:hypothetical protein
MNSHDEDANNDLKEPQTSTPVLRTRKTVEGMKKKVS